MKHGLGIVVISLVISAAGTATRPASSRRASTNESAVQPTPPPAMPSAVGEKAACNLKIAEAPALYGLKLGVASTALLALFPGSELDPDVMSDLSRPPSRFGTSSLLIRPAKYQSKDRFRGINMITFTLLDGRVSSINLSYDGPYYSHVDKFVELVVSKTGLPHGDQWEPQPGLEDQFKILKCADFEVRVFAGGEGNLNYVLLQDLEAEMKLNERRSSKQ